MATMDPLLARRVADVPSSVIRDLLSLVDSDRVLSLAGGLPPTELLPDDEVAAVAARVLGRGGALQYGPTEGFDPLRDWIAGDRLGGVDRDGVLVTHGSQQALDLLVRVLVDPGDVVVTETPTYLGMLQALGGSGARVEAIPTDADGIDTGALEARLEGGLRPKLAYLAPTHQNPSGAVMSVDRRAHLGALAERFRFVVVDDDPYRELGFEAAPPRLRQFVPADLAVTLGTFSKTVAPGLRVGWVHLPRWLHGPMVRAKQAADLHTSILNQRIVHEVLRTGMLDEHVPAIRARYQLQRDAMQAALERHMTGLATWARPTGGMFFWLELREGIDAMALLPRAVEAGMAYVPGAAFYAQAARANTLRLSFVTASPAQIAQGVEMLARVLGAAS